MTMSVRETRQLSVLGQNVDTYYTALFGGIGAILAAIAGVSPNGLFYRGIVDSIPGPGQFRVISLAGLGAGAFVPAGTAPYQVYIARDAGGAGALPQGMTQDINAYVTATGIFTVPIIAWPIDTGDEVLILNPVLTAALDTLTYLVSNLPFSLSQMQGLVYYGVVDNKPGANQFRITALAGLGDGKFANAGSGLSPYVAYCLRDAGGLGNFPQGQQNPVTAYVDATGVFTAAGFAGGGVDVGDEVLIMHQYISAWLLDIKTYVDALATNWTAALATALGNYTAARAAKIDYLTGNVALASVLGALNTAASIVVDNATPEIAYVKGILNQLATIAVLTETSGTLTADGTEQNIVINNAPAAVFKPLKIKLDLENMDANDTVVIKLYERIKLGGNLNLSDQPITYTGLVGGLTNGQKQITIGLDPNKYGFKVTLQQTAHVSYKNYDWEYISEV